MNFRAQLLLNLFGSRQSQGKHEDSVELENGGWLQMMEKCRNFPVFSWLLNTTQAAPA